MPCFQYAEQQAAPGGQHMKIKGSSKYTLNLQKLW